MKWLVGIAAWTAARARHKTSAGRSCSPLWAALALCLTACGQTVAAAPVRTATVDYATPALASPALARPTQLSVATPVRPSATAVPSDPPNTAPPKPSQPTRLDQPGLTATATPPATPTPTAQAKPLPTLGAFSITPLAGATLVTPNPTAVSAQKVGPSIVNVLLIGTDARPTDSTFRTDTLILVSINKEAGAVSLLSIPRDLFIYIPTFGMARINRAFQLAGNLAFPGGGPGLLEQTILYNLGIPIQYYALVNFDGFRKVVDILGGIDVPVNCQLTEYKLKDPTLDERVVANYQLFTLPIGLTHMDGGLALWYARARPVGGDFFRGYRQRQVLRAIYHTGLNGHILPQIPSLYESLHDVVQTDMGLWDVMQFAPLAARLDDSSIRSFNIGPNQSSGWTTPDGEDVLIPKPDAIALVVKDFLNGATANKIAKPLTWVQVSSGANPGDGLAIETLHTEGFGVKEGEPSAPTDFTTIVDHTTSAKGSPIKRLQSILHVADPHVVSQPDANNPVSFQVIIGADYNSCPRLDWMDTTTTGSSSR